VTQTDRGLGVSMAIVATGVTIAGLYWFRDLLTPLALAIFLWLVIDGFADGIGRWAPIIPRKLALVVAFLIVLMGLAGVIAVIAENAAEFATRTAAYQSRLNEVIAQGHALLRLQGEPPTVGQLFSRANPSRFLGDIANALQGVTSQSLFVLIYMACLFAAQATFPRKLDAIFPEKAARAQARHVAGQVRETMEQYLWVQTATGVMIAAASWLVFMAIGLDNALFWALITFLFSYVPVLGGALGSLLPALFALVQFPTIAPALIVLGGTQAIQFVVGNLIQPRMTGDSLNISILVVFLSLALWGFIWGIPGMFLAVPLTVMLMIVLNQFASTRWIAILLSADGRPQGAPRPRKPRPTRGSPPEQAS
jgi:AI-2 transport protein TqsA